MSKINVWDTVDAIEITSKTDKESSKKDIDYTNEGGGCSRVKITNIINMIVDLEVEMRFVEMRFVEIAVFSIFYSPKVNFFYPR